jgi:hypothetical protein
MQNRIAHKKQINHPENKYYLLPNDNTILISTTLYKNGFHSGSSFFKIFPESLYIKYCFPDHHCNAEPAIENNKPELSFSRRR